MLCKDNVKAEKRFSQQAIEKLRTEIRDAGGNEIFALGSMNDLKLVTAIKVSARGNKGSVLAIEDKTIDELSDVLIHNHPSGFLTPSDNDLVISSQAAEAGIGSYIVDNDVENVYVVAEPVKKQKLVKLNPKKICSALEPGGSISRRLSEYEIREPQLDLMQLIIRGFNEDSLIAAEAGTGVGKSFAYLLPALSYSTANNERIVISTATINLQEQLFGKDIPLVTSALNKKIKAVLVKGRGNYLCRRRLRDSLMEQFSTDDDRKQIEDISRWADTTSNGSRSDLSFMPSEGIWSRVCSEADTCMSMRCPERENCFVMLLRREASDAHILVVNHHLLFADLAARRSGAGYTGQVVLPPYNRVIIDEAHTIEESATSFFSEEFSRLGVYRQLGRLYRKRRAHKSGLLLRLASFLPSVPGSFEDSLEGIIEKIRNAVDSLDEAAQQLCGTEGVFRLVPQRKEFLQNGLFPDFITLRKQLNSLAGIVRDLLEQVPEKSNEESVVWEVRSVLRRLEAMATICSSFMEFTEKPDHVMWMEKRGGKEGDAPFVVFHVTPLDIAPYLAEALFEPNKTVICVSATLTTANSFNYWMERSGFAFVNGRKKLDGIFPSPFPYHSKVLLAVPENAPLPNETDYDAFVDDTVTRLVEASGGSALILFTSYKALKSAYEAALPVLQKQDIRVLKQGDDDRNRLLNSFLKDERSVLFATDSFWEGVDAPGDTLRLVILCRLPFRSPNDPVLEARCEAIGAKGGNPFMDLSLPEAVMKFKQGFGRLMRRSSDHGVVAVLDGRIIRKHYGKFFLHSLPDIKTCFSDMKTLLRSMENFLF